MGDVGLFNEGNFGHKVNKALKNCIVWINSMTTPNAASSFVTKLCQNVKYTTEYMEGTVRTRILNIADSLVSKSTWIFE